MSGRERVRADLEGVFRAALRAVDPADAVRRVVVRDGAGVSIAGAPVPPDARFTVLAAGKAALAMAGAFEEVAGSRIATGLAVAPAGSARSLGRIRVRETAHPVPDERCERAAREAIDLVRSTPPDDVLVVMISGGASSLLSCPAEGLSLADVARTTETLLLGGAPIDELNAVRKHTSAVAGGRLARLAGSERIELLVMSDVPGDRLDVIGSGPFCADPTRYERALRALDRRGGRAAFPTRVRVHLEAGARGEIEETPKPGNPALARVRSTLLATNATARRAARAACRARGLRPIDLGECLAGEAREVGRRLAALATALEPPEPLCAVAGGETAVTVRGAGKGGRSQELALAAALELERRSEGGRVALLAAGTDGIDGPTDAAGALVDADTPARARRAGRDPVADLARNDAHPCLDAAGALVRTGPTGTNVMDLALLWVGPR